MNKAELKSLALGALRRLQKLPNIVRGFFADPHWAYIHALLQDQVPTVQKLTFSFVSCAVVLVDQASKDRSASDALLAEVREGSGRGG